MIREITLGQYYKTESVVHRLDPRTKLILTFAYILSLFINTNIYTYIAAFLVLTITIVLCRVPLKFILRGMKAIIILMIVTVLFNMFLIEGDVIFKWWALKVTRQGLVNAGFMIARLIMLVLGSSIMTLTTTPNNLADGMESVMKPLKIFKVPVHEMAMMMSIALRFIPILMDETDKIMKAQLARGADFESGNLIKRTKSLLPVLIPLFVSAFRRAGDLAMAMEARCYRGGNGRTKMKPLKYAMRDYVAYALCIVYFLFVIFSKKMF